VSGFAWFLLVGVALNVFGALAPGGPIPDVVSAICAVICGALFFLEWSDVLP
jgi:hypothetical protein